MWVGLLSRKELGSSLKSLFGFQRQLEAGAYAGMAIFQDRTATSVMTLSGGSNWDFKGTVYAAKAHVDISGGSGGSMGSQYISDTLTLSGSSTFQDIDPNDGFGPKNIQLVE
jgi:hypothetical protein